MYESPYTVVPKIILTSFFNHMIAWLRTDIKNNTNTPEKAYLYQMFKPYGIEMQFQDYNYYAEAIQIFSRNQSSSDKIKIHSLFDPKLEKALSIIIGEESDRRSETTIGVGEGLLDLETDYNEDTYPTFSEFREAEYIATIFSQNSNELDLLITVFKSLFITFSQPLQTIGLMDIDIRVKKMDLIEELTPNNYFKQSILVRFRYQFNSPSLTSYPNWEEIQFSGTPTNDLETQ